MASGGGTIFCQCNSLAMNEFIRYLLVGLVNTGIGYTAILICQFSLEMTPIAANGCGYAIGLMTSYLLNKKFTFRAQTNHTKHLPMFVLVAGICYLLNVGVLFVTSSWFNLPPAIAQAAAVASYTLSFFFASRHFVFSPSRN